MIVFSMKNNSVLSKVRDFCDICRFWDLMERGRIMIFRRTSKMEHGMMPRQGNLSVIVDNALFGNCVVIVVKEI
jgi:hypothetical protein